MANTPATISVKALRWSCRDGVNQTKPIETETHAQLDHARQLRDVVGNGDELSIVKLRQTGDA